MRPEYSTRLVGLRLDLCSRSKRDVESLIRSLQNSAPRLEYLALQCTSWESVTISSFTSRLPSLRRLRLRNVSPSSWLSPIFTSLHELDVSFDLHRVPRSHDALLSHDEMCTILSRMPELRRLALQNVFAEGTRPDGMQHKHIFLPNLRQLSLIDQLSRDLFTFASSLCLPSETCAEIKKNGVAWEGSFDPVTLLPQYERTFGPVRRLKLLTNGHPQVTLHFRASDALTVERSSPAQLRLAYTLLSSSPPPPHAAETAPPPPHEIVHHFGAAQLRLDGLLYLDIASYATWPAYCWRALFAHAARLQQIRATYRGAVDGLILYILLAADPDGEPSPLLPALRSVKLSLVDLDETVDVADHPPRVRGDLLLDGLAQRRRDLPGSEMWELEVPDHDGCWVAKLRSIVPSTLHAGI